MPKRPGLTTDTFLKHLFAPRKNPAPTGMRKSNLVWSKSRSRARVNAYNRMSAVNREVLKQSGMRESYLRGEVALKDAKSALRQTAVAKGYAKPLRSKTPGKAPAASRTGLDALVTGRVIAELRKAGKQVDPGKVQSRVPHMPTADKQQAVNWTANRIVAYAGDDTHMVWIDGKRVNPLWYHA